MRGHIAVFSGAFLIALIYATKSESGPVVTIARAGSTALVLDTTRADSTSSADSAASRDGRKPNDALTAPDPSVAPLTAGTTGGSSSPAVGPADLDVLRSENLLIPVAGVAAKDLVNSFDDMRDGTRHHNALDIMAARNTPVVSATDARVLKLHNSVAGGLTIYESDPSGKYVMMYGHLDSYRPGLKEGETVKRGQIIGFVGSTGNASALAPHLHFQVTRNDNLKEWWKGTPLNPFPISRPKG